MYYYYYYIKIVSHQFHQMWQRKHIILHGGHWILLWTFCQKSGSCYGWPYF